MLGVLNNKTVAVARLHLGTQNTWWHTSSLKPISPLLLHTNIEIYIYLYISTHLHENSLHEYTKNIGLTYIFISDRITMLTRKKHKSVKKPINGLDFTTSHLQMVVTFAKQSWFHCKHNNKKNSFMNLLLKIDPFDVQ